MRPLTAVALSSAALLVAGCAGTDPGPTGPSSQAVSNDCAVILALAKEHYRFGPDNQPPRLNGGGDEQWRPSRNTESHEFAFTTYVDPLPGSDPRTTMKWVSCQKPV